MGQTETKQSPVRLATEEHLVINHRKKMAQISNTEASSLPSVELKKVLKAVLKEYSDENLLHPYSPKLKKCLKEYNSLKLAQFFMDCVQIAADQKNTKPKKEGSNGVVVPAFYKKIGQEKKVGGDDGSKTPRANPRNEEKNDSFGEVSHESDEVRNRRYTAPEKTMIKSFKILSNVGNSLWKYFELEVMKKDNLFCELIDTFSKMYAEQYSEELRNFATAKTALDSKVPYDLVIGPKVRERIVKSYEKCKIDIKRYQNFQYDILNAFLKEVSKWSGNEESLVPSQKVLDPMNQKLLFTRGDCYQTYFTMTRYFTIGDEAKLKICAQKLQKLKLEEFGVEKMLCMDQKETPYQVIIDSLNYLDTFTTPQEKFQVVSKMRGQILKEVDKYWEESYKQGIIKKKLTLTADQLMPLNCYCLVSSMNEKVRAHQLVIEDFLDEKTLGFGEQSYYFTTFKAAIDFLVGISQDPVKGILSINRQKENSK